MSVRIDSYYDPKRQAYNLYVQINRNNKISYLKDLIFKTTDTNLPIDYVPSIDRYEYEALMQELTEFVWKQSYRPKDYQQDNKEIKRIEKHLEDMRALVFDKYEMDVPIK